MGSFLVPQYYPDHQIVGLLGREWAKALLQKPPSQQPQNMLLAPSLNPMIALVRTMRTSLW